MTPDPASQCTPSHCTWGDLGSMYSSPSFLVGLAVIAAAAALFLARRRMPARIGWIGWAILPLLIIASLIGAHHG